MDAPWPPLRRPCRFYGARQVSWLTAYRRRRLPGPAKSPVARKASARRSQSRGRPRIDKRPTVFPFHPRAQSRDLAGFMSQLREGLSNGAQAAFLRSEAARRPRLRASVGADPKHRTKTRPDFGGQIFERRRGRTSGPKKRSQLPQRRNLSFCNQGAPGQDGAFSFRRKILCAEQRFGESALHFVLQQGECVLSGPTWQCRVGGTAKPGADRHEICSAHHRWRANRERGEAAEELSPRDKKRPHLS
jgi:hypothetical protein